MSGKYIGIFFCTLLMTAVSCNKQRGTEIVLPSNSQKIVHTKAGADPGMLLVKLADVKDLADLQATAGVSAVKPLFVSTPGNEELEREFGLDRWFEAYLEAECDVEDMAAKLSALQSVAVVEYAIEMTRSYEDTQAFYAAESSTKADNDAIFNDPRLGDQWHYINNGSRAFGTHTVAGADVNVKDVWANLTCGDPSIIIAVVDEGVKYSHPDLKANMWSNTREIPNNGIDDDGNGYIDDVYGYNFADGKPEIVWSGPNMSGHGTHVAGTIAAVNNNGIGVCGVAGGSGKNDGCRIMSCQIFGNTGGGSVSVSANAIKYAADNGASIISCSFGYNVRMASDNAYIRSVGSAEIDAIHYFEAHKGNNPVITDGNIAIFAAGNEAHDFAHYPGAFHDIISVSAFGPDFLPTNYTNFGPGCSIAAPGGEVGLCDTWASCVLSTIPSEVPSNFDKKYKTTGADYAYMQGTSMACPHVSGVVALGLSYAKKTGKTYTKDQFKQMILSSTNDIDQRIGKTASKSYVNVILEGGSYIKAHNELALAPFYHNVGTGAIDAWRLMMKVDGTPCLTTKTGELSYMDLTDILGTSSVSLTYLDVEVPQETIDAMGLQKLTPKKASGTNGVPVPSAECYAYEQFGRLYMHATKVGSGKLTLKVVGGGDKIGGGDNPPGGMEIDAHVSVIARPVKSNNGGWL